MHSSRRGPVSLVAVAALALFGLNAVAPGAASASSQSASAPSSAQTTATRSAARTATPSPGRAAARFVTTPHSPALPAGVRQVCAKPSHPGQMTCMALVRTNVKSHAGVAPDDAAPPAGSYSPNNLQSAYSLASAESSFTASGETVAVVDAYNDPNAASDLKTYRAQYGLPPCATSTGVGTGAGCVTVVNQTGGASLPTTDPTGSWELEESIDLDMVSAICPACHILLVEANSTDLSDLGTAENYAAAHAKFVTNSWGSGGEFTGESAYDSRYFDHPGVAVTFAAGDYGYGPQYPAASQFVTSVGGTTLTQGSSTTRGWTETAWSGTGSGCSAAEAKPSWQAAIDGSRGSGAWDPNGCLNRTHNDVAAVADPTPGVAIYDSYTAPGISAPDWTTAGGTSVASPIIASVYALAGTPTPNTYPSSYLYRAKTGLYDVTGGTNGTCESNRLYLCHSGTGYDGPTGLGTPNGAGAFKNAATTNIVSVKNPGTQDFVPGTHVGLRIQALDSAGQSPTYIYSATGLPGGLSINASSGLISGTVANSPGTHTVQVTATDTSRVTGTVKFNIVVMPNLDTAYTAGSGTVKLALGGKCLDDANNSSANGNKIQIWNCLNDASQNWKFRPDGTPGGAGTLNIQGKCADVTNRSTAPGAKIQLWSCNGGASQQWFIAGFGVLVNPASNLCLDDPGASTANGTRVDIAACIADPNTGAATAKQNWTLPASEVTSGIAGKCLDDANNSSANGNKVQIWNCTGGASQKWVYASDGTIRINGKCLDMAKASTLDGAKLQLWTCLRTNGVPNFNQTWVLGPGAGELVNANSSRCLADPGDSTGNGTPVTQEDCYGRAGEIWQVS
ncbi:MAG TPA: ricin-type beta-trefoil lectin domain protein [Streptosporangiaceae bacterium]|nr:ricin-type beta-trefoil lectin domain protein [Streptosporangiaceae bacterium]